MPNFQSNEKKKISTLNTLVPRISSITWYPVDEVKTILGCIVPEMKYDIAQGFKFSLIWIANFEKKESSYNTRFNKRLNAEVKVRYNFRLKIKPSRVFVEELNFLEKKNY